MNATENFKGSLHPFSEKFSELTEQYDQREDNSSDLETVIDDYSMFITNKDNSRKWEQLDQQEFSEVNQLAGDLRRKSAICVGIMEKYRARKLLEGNEETVDYFRNIESCIEREFGSFQLNANSKVLLVGSGSFPMTALLIARRTGAEVVGIDIDEEAVELGRHVTGKLGEGLNIRLEETSAENLDSIRDVTHIIFSSTVESKYDILDQLFALTNDQVVVAMRYGNQLKSLFNFPLREVDDRKWELVEQILRPQHIFDIALYKKASLV
ncbi:class I SAM-dependent methyltransferase [Jeotgalibacillus sp. S-D1]|uniref:class I SAM-dependent methyltransferase n=1 Tax=Jeotgalibacillus sp. S-D1 TaxID=2552189 RepID=UPI001059E3C7|nr:class I SAM-dependent methyltransferase [Jeotgalibacillus sp. S-D1]TDL32728.1 class I SAM-dependent methyltransferase [Jeotgalibacillus sp. S-D1]